MSTKGRAGPILPMVAGAALAAHRIVALGAADNQVIYPAAQTGPIIGVTDRPAMKDEPVDVCVMGIVAVQYGGNVTRGALLTGAADGEAVVTAAANDRVAGVALKAGVAGDRGLMIITQGIV